MKIALVSRNDVNDIGSWSGTDYNVFHALKEAGEGKNISLYVIDKLRSKRDKVRSLLEKVYTKLLWKIFRKKINPDHNRTVIEFYAKQIQKELPEDIDVIFSMTSWPITYVKSNKLKVFYSDADIGDLLELYPAFSKYSKNWKSIAIEMRKDAIDNCDLVLFASDWAANGTINRYGITDTNKIKVVPFGANIECTRTKDDIAKLIENKERNVCNLLFVGVNWDYKGGAIALETAKILHENGVNVHLDIVGINDCPVVLPIYAESHGFISKSTREGRKKLDDFYEKAHFFILPTRFDAYGVVFCEASSFGVPSLVSKAGGAPIINGQNGQFFELSDNGDKYAEYIQTMLADYENYKKMCFSSFEQYETRLNWKVVATKILDYIEEELAKKL